MIREIQRLPGSDIIERVLNRCHKTLCSWSTQPPFVNVGNVISSLNNCRYGNEEVITFFNPYCECAKNIDTLLVAARYIHHIE